MPTGASLLQWLHFALAFAWLAGTIAQLLGRNRKGNGGRLAGISAAVLAGTLPLYLLESGWWPDLPARMLVPGVATLALFALLGPQRPVGRLALFALAGFYLALGALSIRNATPLQPHLAVKSILLGAALLPAVSGRGLWRAWHAITLVLLLAAAALGLTGEIPLT